MKYIKIPVPVDAFQYDGDLIDRTSTYYVPTWAQAAYQDGLLFYQNPSKTDLPPELYLKVSSHDIKISVGDYIIKDIRGNIFACNKDIFEESYQLIKE